MKTAVVFATYNNIGDDIQTLAALRFAPDAVFVDRDKISIEKRKLKIIGGHYWLSGKNFPPKNYIDFLPISMHIADPNLDLEWFKKREPIGCRDLWTKKHLEENNIEAYFSGCLTLTFPEYSGERKGIIYVDVPDEIKEKDGLSISNIIPGTDILGVRERLEIAEERIELFKRAELVITSRLHVALPCVAIGTPVALHRSSILYRPERFEGYEFIKDFNGFNEDYKVNKPIELIQNLDRKIKEFVK